ncbi:MAG: glycosyltransferase [Caldilineaceae bacterium]
MRITVLAVGSRGDAQPYMALGMGLQQAGHEVKIATHEVFREMVTERGLEFGLIRLNPQEMLKQEAGQAWMEAGKNPLRFIRHMARAFAPLLHEMLTDCLHACEGSDVVLISPLAIAALPAVERVGARAMLVTLWSNLPTHDYPSLYAPTLPFGGPIAGLHNRLTYDLAALPKRLFGRPIWQALDRWQREVLRVDPMSADQLRRRMLSGEWPMLAGYSPSVFPRPSDWPEWVHVTGYWFLNAEPAWQPPATLVDFLQAGPAPVYIGFGSMAGRNPQRRGEIAVKALEQSGQRGILLTGWGGLQPNDLPDSVLAVDSVPHDWLFPRMAAVVHHGGAGTTAAGLRAGKPTVVAPFFGDQPFWGRRVAELRVGPDPIPQKKLSVEKLAGAIRSATDDGDMHRRAQELAQWIRAEDGIGRAVELVHRFATREQQVFAVKAVPESVPGAAHRFEWEGS